MKKFISLSLVGLAGLLIAGCGSGGGGGGGGISCQPGQVVDTATNTCIFPDSGIVPNGGTMKFYDFTKQFVSQGYGQPRTFNGDMKITNRGAYKTFLKEAMAVCDRGSWGNYGISKCDAWLTGAFELEVRIDSDLKPALGFKAYPQLDIFNYNFQMGFDRGGYAFNPLLLNTGTLSLINQSTGLEIRANGSYLNGGGLRLVQLIVRKGTLADTNITYELFYPHEGKATQFATGVLKRY